MKNHSLNYSKISDLKDLTKQRIIISDNTVKYWTPVSYQALQTQLKFSDSAGEEILNKLNLKQLDHNEPMPEETMQNFLLELGYDSELVVLNNWAERFQQFLFSDSTPNYQKGAVIVTIMGHVDHGKTTLLDVIHNSNLAQKEVGLITQKVGGYQIIHQKQPITFIDTPGHNLFSQMRQQGAKLTDIVVLVVSGVEGVKPQTIEAIEYAKKANVPIIVFVNKMDLSQADFEGTINQVSKYDLIPKKWGGKTEYLAGSCLKKEGISELLTKILEISNETKLIRNFSALAKAVVLDSFVDHQGIKASIIVKEGTLKLRDKFIAETTIGKVKALIDDRQRNLTEVTPGKHAMLLGLTKVLEPGSYLYQFSNDKFLTAFAKSLVTEQATSQPNVYAGINRDALIAKIFDQTEANQTLNFIIKVDTKATEEVLRNQLSVWTTKNASARYQLHFVTLDSGSLTLKDVNLARVSHAKIITFNLKSQPSIIKKLEQFHLELKEFTLLYELFDYLDDLQAGKIREKFTEKVLGTAKILKVFDHSKFGKIAGGVVLKGTIKIAPQDFFKITRNDEVIAEKLKAKSLQQKKLILQSVTQNQEFGIIFHQTVNFVPGDIISQYQLIAKNE